VNVFASFRPISRGPPFDLLLSLADVELARTEVLRVHRDSGAQQRRRDDTCTRAHDGAPS